MNRSRKILSLFLVIAALAGVIVTSSLSVSGDMRTCAFKFNYNDYRPDLVNNRPTMLVCENDGSFNMKSSMVKQQYQMFFEVKSDNASRLADAINEANGFYDGGLNITVAVNSAVTSSGGNCSPRIMVSLLSSKDPGDIVATTGGNSQSPEQVSTYNFDVSKFIEQEYNNDIKFVYVLVEYYTVRDGVKPDVTFYPIYVDNGDKSDVSIATPKPDPNQTTFFNFNPKGYEQQNNPPSEVRYSSNGSTWKSGGLAKETDYGYLKISQANLIEQMQVSFNFSNMTESARNALAIVNGENGTGKIKFDLNLAKCLDPNGSDAIAEVEIILSAQKGIQSEAPEDIEISSWQFPGTTRTYYLDVSKIKHYSQFKSININIQNYWYYNETKTKLFDYDKESNYGGEAAAIAKGYQKCKIKPTVIISPFSAVKNDKPGQTYKNTDYDFVLNRYNQNGAKVPADVTAGDPNAGGGDIIVTTASSTTSKPIVVTPGKPTVKSAALTTKNKAKITWSAVKVNNAKITYNIYRAVGSNKASAYKLLKKGITSLSYTDSTVKSGKKYYYKVKAVNNSKLSSYSNVKYVKVLNYTAQPVLKAKSGKKSSVVSISKKVTNASKYQVYYSTNKKFKSLKKKTISSKATIKKLSSKKTYYMKVRAYNTYNKKNYYGKWSKVIKVKIK